MDFLVLTTGITAAFYNPLLFLLHSCMW